MGLGSPSEVLPGERIGRYTVVRRLAVGGMAEVYLARHEGPKGFAKLVVIKRVLPGLQQTEKFVAMFLDEGRLAARLSHPSIVQAFELGDHDGSFHIVMEYVPGESLNRMVKRATVDNRPIPAGSVLRVAMQVLEALDYAHDLKGDRGEWLKVVHRDVSPTNVIITYHGGVKLLDFGIARSAIHEHHTQLGTVKGKGGYMSPEQALAAPVDQRTDIYAVGALLYLLTTGVGPFESQDDVFAMMKAAVDGRFPRPSARNPAIHPQLEQIILKAMAQKADDRYPTAGLMLADLEEYAAAQKVFPSSRELTIYLRQLFPDRVELARSFDQALDAAMIAKLAESFSDAEGSEIVATPTKPARRLSSKPEEVAAPTPLPKRPVPRGLDAHDEKTPLHAAPLRDGPPVSLRTNTRTVPIASAHPAPAPPLPPPVEKSPAYAGAVPEKARSSSERATVEARAIFGFDDAEEKTAAAFPAGHPGHSVSARTVSAEQEMTGPSLAHTADAPPPVPRTRSLANMASVGNLVASNPWAFVVAGLAAVLLGVAVLWALGGD